MRPVSFNRDPLLKMRDWRQRLGAGKVSADAKSPTFGDSEAMIAESSPTFWRRAGHCWYVVLLVLLFATQAVQAQAPGETLSPQPRQLSGRTEYLVHCASCHGMDGKGAGPVAEFLKQRPTNLTLLAKNNGGTFPEKRLYDVIDGTAIVGAHGTREMPVWGEVFARQASNTFNRAETEREVRGRITRLIDYLKSMQKK